MSAALRLAERGYSVKLIEANDRLGGNLGSRTGADGVPLDVYPHMYLNWYRNLWRLLADVTEAEREPTRFRRSEPSGSCGEESSPSSPEWPTPIRHGIRRTSCGTSAPGSRLRPT